MRTLKLTLSYDGTRLVGWQRQAAGDSVQGAARGRAGAVRRRPGDRARRRPHRRRRARARTGGQRARSPSRTTPPRWSARSTPQLPEDVRVLSVEDAAPGFHARFDARSKTYRYCIRNGPVASPFERAVRLARAAAARPRGHAAGGVAPARAPRFLGVPEHRHRRPRRGADPARLGRRRNTGAVPGFVYRNHDAFGVACSVTAGGC